MKSIYKKIKISYFLLIVILVSLLSGLFKDILSFFSVILIHELGHIIMSLVFKWNISEIDIGITGGFITYDETIDKPFIEELLIAAAGFISQSIYFLLVIILYKNNVIDYDLFFLIKKYYLGVLVFNLIPIMPLDASKILQVILSIFFSYKKTLKLINLISFINVFIIILIFLFFKFKIEYSYIMIISFVISYLIKNIKEIPYLFNKFLFERYMYPLNVKKYEYIKGKNLNKLKRQRKHYFKINNHYYKEREILSKIFD